MTPFYERGGITIYCGDCLDVMLMLDAGFDSIIADLPYGVTASKWDIVIPFAPLWVQYKRLIKARGAVALFGSQPFTTDLINSNRKRYKYSWYWDKGLNSTPFLAKYQPLRVIEDILIFGNESVNYNPQIERKLNNIRPKNESQIHRSSIYGQNSVKFNSLGSREIPVDMMYPKNIISIQGVPPGQASHPNQKPVKLLQYLIKTYTNAGESVLDNTMGSGTTLVAAQNLGRRAVGIEMNEDYCKIAVERLRQPSFFSIPDEPKRAEAIQGALL